jgi:hypothetical protein
MGTTRGNLQRGNGDAGMLGDIHAAARHLRQALAALDHTDADVAAAFVAMALDCCEREIHSGTLRSKH